MSDADLVRPFDLLAYRNSAVAFGSIVSMPASPRVNSR